METDLIGVKASFTSKPEMCELSVSYVYILKLFSFLPALKGQHSRLIQ